MQQVNKTAYIIIITLVDCDKIMHVHWDFDALNAWRWWTHRVHWTSITIVAIVHYFVTILEYKVNTHKQTFLSTLYVINKDILLGSQYITK